MTSTSPFDTIAILGPGLLGGSVALAAKRYLEAREVRLWGRRREPLDYARKLGGADLCTQDLAEAVSEADLIVMASPIGAMRALAESFLPFVKPGAVVTDVGSVKGSVHRDAGAFLQSHGVCFIGSHPMAGSEKQGIQYATTELFKQASVILTNDGGMPLEQVDRLNRFWACLGATCLWIGAEEHDRLVARVSHLPHAMAAACVNAACDGIDMMVASQLASSGFRDTTRVADGAPGMWAEILLENGEALGESLARARDEIALLLSLLKSGDREGVAVWLERAKNLRGDVVKDKQT